MTRQGTVHLWENSDSQRAFCNLSDAYINVSSSNQVEINFTPHATSESDDAVLYSHDNDLVT